MSESNSFYSFLYLRRDHRLACDTCQLSQGIICPMSRKLRDQAIQAGIAALYQHYFPIRPKNV